MLLRSLPFAIALALPAVASAQTDSATDLDKVVVTATRGATTANEALAAVETIDRDQIERSQARSLIDLLRGHAGINLVNQGGAGKLTTLFLRGTESDHTLFLVDGVRIGSATSGLASLQDLPLEQIERIEIVRGPRSSLYGADAIGGVIQVFTRRRREGSSAHFMLGAGSHGLREGSAGFDVGNGHAWFGADLAAQRSDGIDACEVARPTPFSGGCFIFAPQPDRDGYRNRSLSLRGGFDAGEAWSFDANAMRAEGHNDYDGDYVDNSDVVQQVIGANARWTPNSSIRLKLTAGRNTDISDNYLGDAFSNRFDTTRDTVSLQGEFTLAEGQLLSAGADWLRDRADVTDPWTPFDAARHDRGVFVQYQLHAGRHDLQAALRHDEDSQFGGHGTGSLAWGMDLAHGLRVSASYGSAFKAPTFNELYYPYYGNPDLAPETSRSFDAAIEQHGEAWHWRLDAYETRIDDLISYDASLVTPERPYGQPNNIDRARIRGAEFTVGASVAGWNLDAQASHADPRSASGYSDGALLPRRARNTARIDADRGVGDWSFGGSLVAEGSRYDDVANSIELGGYATVALHVEWKFAPAWRLQARIDNLFDRDYETAAFYRQPGREFGLRLRYSPK